MGASVVLFLKIILNDEFLRTRIIDKKNKIMQVDANENKIGLELTTAILSMFDVILQIKATRSISRVPSSLIRLMKGSKIPSAALLTLRIYEPTTVVNIPTVPRGVGNSPSIIGEVIRRKTGVNETIGSVKESGESLIAFTNSKEVTVFKKDVAKSAVQNV